MRREKIRNIAEKLGCKYDSIVGAVRAFDYTAMSESPSITEDELSLLLENDIQEEKKLSAELLDSLLKDRVRKQV